MNFINLIWKPNLAVDEAVKKKEIKDSIVVLIIGAILMALAFAILFSNIAASFTSLNIIGLVFFAIICAVLIILAGLIKGFFLYKVMEALGTKSSYFAGVSTFAYSLVPISVGFLLASLLFKIPDLGMLLAFLIATPFVLLGTATMYNGVKTFFKTDMIIALVGVSAFMLGVLLVFYFVLIYSIMQSSGTLVSSMMYPF
ncbi:hypothetical protein KO317_02790 [Candidatus Micrarchaeota archaeon]|jgi:hypothetical protein|nr:hypothetical protein [Candidatus Micrarchaeota archaeon]